MSINLSEQDIQRIIESVMKNVESALEKTPFEKPTEKPSFPGMVSPMKMKTIIPAESTSFEKNKSKETPQKESPKKMIFPGMLTPLGEKPGASNRFETSNNQVNVARHGNENGIFDNMEDAIEAGDQAQKDFLKNYSLKDRERLLDAIRQVVLKEKEVLAKMVYEETKLGRLEDKIAKHELAAQTPGTEDLKTDAISGDDGLTIVEQAPFGLIGAITPVTNPSETIINNAIAMLAAGNGVVFNVHPSSKRSSAYAVALINKAIKSAGGPENLITMVKNPTLDTVQQLIDSPKIRLLVGTGGPGLVKSLLQSGKKAIGAGAGNPPVIVDDTADLENAAKSIIEGASFDNNLLCIAEKEVFVLDSVADDLIFNLLNYGAYMLDHNELAQIESFIFEENKTGTAAGCSLEKNREYHMAKEWIGKDAISILGKIGVKPKDAVRLLICEVDFAHPLVQLEQMMPVLPIVRVADIDEAIELAVQAEHGNRHTAVMHSKNVDNITRFARAIETTIFVQNGPSLAGVGFGGEGHTTMTIAGPTGEGVTSPRTYTRQRRSVLTQGGFRIIG